MTIANVTLNDTFAEWVVKTNQLIAQSQNNYTLSVSSYNAVNSASFTAANIAADVLSTNNTFIINISNQLISSGNLMNAVLSNTAIMNTIYTSANTLTAEYLTSNSDFINSITINVTSGLIESNTLANNVLANTLILNTIYDNANVISNTVTTDILNTSVYIDSIVDALIVDGQLSNTVLSNTVITTTIYDNANTIADAFNANSNLSLAWNTANAAFDAAFDTANALSDLANTALANTDSYTLVINNLTITGNLILSGPDAVLDML